VDKKYDRVLVDDYQTYQACKKQAKKYSGEHHLRVEFYRDKVPMFERFNVEREIDKALRRKIWLPCGGYLFVDKTEAMTTIDVNSGRSQNNVVDVEESLVQINLEAAEEIARQLRLRNVGGLIICDFIDMRMRRNQRRVLEKLRDHMKEDSAKCMVLGMSEFGLVEMTRQRSRGSLMQTMFETCPYCTGSGWIKSLESMSIDIERALKKAILCEQQFALKLTINPHLYEHMKVIDKEFLEKIADKMNAYLTIETSDAVHLNDFHFYSTTNNERIEV